MKMNMKFIDIEKNIKKCAVKKAYKDILESLLISKNLGKINNKSIKCV
jgi:hypothetical protein